VDGVPAVRIGNYEVVSTLGSGGQGVVYLARHLILDRLDAVKVLVASASGDVARFRREAVAAARLHHPNIAGVFDAGQAADGSFYVAMQYVNGPSLARLGVLPAARCAALIAGLAGALDAAHAGGLLHRDVKPSNVLVAGDHPYLVDFGIASVSVVAPGREPETGPVMGTVGYIAPERLAVSGPREGPAADQYSLACTAYFCLTGTAPQPMRAPVRRTDLTPAVDAVFARALSADPAARYPSCQAFAAAFRECVVTAAPTRAVAPTPVAPTLLATRVASGRTRAFGGARFFGGSLGARIFPGAGGSGAAASRVPGGWVPPRAAAVRIPDLGRSPLAVLGLLLALAVVYFSSVPLQLMLHGSTDVVLELRVQYCAVLAMTFGAGWLGTWLLARRSSTAWFMLLLSLLTVPVLRLGAAGSLGDALSWVAFAPLEPGYSAFSTAPFGLNAHGVFLTLLAGVTALVYAYGWWRWSAAVPVGRLARREWPWFGGAVIVVALAAMIAGDLPSDVGTLIAFALGMNLVAMYALARKYVEGWLFFGAAQVLHLSYVVAVTDRRPRPSSMVVNGLVGAGTPIGPALSWYYVAVLLVGVLGWATWLVDQRRVGPPAFIRKYG
jgi:hypothetical protein